MTFLIENLIAIDFSYRKVYPLMKFLTDNIIVLIENLEFIENLNADDISDRKLNR